MFGTLRYYAVGVLMLGALSAVAVHIATTTSRGWFERDARVRAEEAIAGAEESLILHWLSGDTTSVRRVLRQITRSERIMAAAACASNGELVTSTDGFPEDYACSTVIPRMRNSAVSTWKPWSESTVLAGGDVLISAVPIGGREGALGAVIVVHDLSFMQRRGEATQRFALVSFSVLVALLAAGSFVAARLARRRWTDELRLLLRGEVPRPEFRPLLTDVQELVGRMAADAEHGSGGAWNPERLRHALARHLHGERIVVVANREPYIHQRTSDGAVQVLHPASGLVTALEPVMRACSGVWVGHGSGSADRATSDRHGRVKVPPGEESYSIRRVWLTDDEERGYYYGFANEALWPLCHIAHARPIFRSEDFEHYRTVNRKFADAVLDEVDRDDPIIFVQDYHFALVPRMIRERLPRATILMFWHIPWPNFEQYGICPFRQDLLEGMLGATILGFHTQSHCNNFLDAVDRYLEARIDRNANSVVARRHTTQVKPYPISIEWPSRWAREAPPVDACRRDIRAQFGLKPDALLGIGVDRLDYTKGIEERLLAVERVLIRHPELRGRFTFVQIAAPSRTKIERYRDLHDEVQRLADRVNRQFGTAGYQPVMLRVEHWEPPDVFRCYRASDVCYVSSLHDGMNLVAKEFVAAREDEQGVLVLSRFTGAAQELTEALLVNPYDLDEASAALAAALTMPAAEQRARMRALRALVAQFNVYRWAGKMLTDAARVREKERLEGRLSGGPRRITDHGAVA